MDHVYKRRMGEQDLSEKGLVAVDEEAELVDVDPDEDSQNIYTNSGEVYGHLNSDQDAVEYETVSMNQLDLLHHGSLQLPDSLQSYHPLHKIEEDTDTESERDEDAQVEKLVSEYRLSTPKHEFNTRKYRKRRKTNEDGSQRRSRAPNAWTEEEEEFVIDLFKRYSVGGRLSAEVMNRASEKLNRTHKAVHRHWHDCLKPKYIERYHSGQFTANGEKLESLPIPKTLVAKAGRVWTQEEDDYLKELYIKYDCPNGRLTAEALEDAAVKLDRTARAVRRHWDTVVNPRPRTDVSETASALDGDDDEEMTQLGKQKRFWSSDEDEQVLNVCRKYDIHGTLPTEVAQEAAVELGRTAKAIRRRWEKHLKSVHLARLSQMMHV